MEWLSVVDHTMAMDSKFDKAPLSSSAVSALIRHNAELQRALESRPDAAELYKSRRRLRTLVENAPICIHEVGLDGVLEGMNPCGTAMLEVADESDVVGLEYLSFVGEAGRERVRGLMLAALNGETAHFEFVSPDGTRTFESSFAPILDEVGRVERLMGCTQEITKRIQDEETRRKLSEQILHVQKLESLGLLAGGVAHDFNNLLAAVLANLSVAMLNLEPNHAAMKSLRAAEGAVENGAELCRQLLSYAGKGKFEAVVVGINDAASRIATLVKGSLPASTQLDLQLCAEDVSVEVSSGQVEQVLLNLVLNASAAFEGAEGVVTVATESVVLEGDDFSCLLGTPVDPGRYAVLSVRDNGPGIPEEVIGQLLEPFFTTNGRGRGLGLSALAGIVRSYKGAIRLETTLGLGTHFQVYLPHSARQPAAKAPVAPSPVQRLRVLVVDDQDVVRSAVKRLLEHLGFETAEAASGAQAVACVEGGALFDAVVLDVSMPGMNGVETLFALRKMHPSLAAVIVSGWEDSAVLKELEGQERCVFVPKPFAGAALAAAIAQAYDEPDSHA
ncbi:MAG: two-component system cell cycle sensor histidine kinase/response regulator CckA [Polyangiales bacterium]